MDGDVYLRFLSFKDVTEFKEELKKKKPIKIDIGAIYTSRYILIVVVVVAANLLMFGVSV